MSNKIKLTDNISIKGREDKFTLMEVNLSKTIKAWQESVFSFEWLNPNGKIKAVNDLSDSYAKQYQDVKKLYEHNKALERPILGFGIMDNVEIGSRKDVLLTLHTLGVAKLEVHIPKSCIKDFEKFM